MVEVGERDGSVLLGRPFEKKDKMVRMCREGRNGSHHPVLSGYRLTLDLCHNRSFKTFFDWKT